MQITRKVLCAGLLFILLAHKAEAAPASFIFAGKDGSGGYFFCKQQRQGLIPGRSKSEKGKGWKSFASRIRAISRNEKLSLGKKRKQISRQKELAEEALRGCQRALRNASIVGSWRTSYSCEEFLTEKCQEAITITFNPDNSYELSLNGGRICYLSPFSSGSYSKKVVPHQVTTRGVYSVEEDGSLVLNQLYLYAEREDCPLWGSSLYTDTDESISLEVLALPLTINNNEGTLSLDGRCPVSGPGLHFCVDQIDPYVRVESENARNG